MPNLPPYSYNGPIDHTAPINESQLKDKCIIITGGSNGIGAELVRQFSMTGAFVTFGDVNQENGELLEAELNSKGNNVQFVQCNVTSWDDQINLFERAVERSPSRSCDIVIANAGISRSSGDSLWKLDNPNEPPVKPELNILNTNLTGSLYTFKLATHYFRKQPDTDDRDRCFIVTGSMTAYIDSPGNFEYTCSKYALRGLLRTVRRSSHDQGVRINYVAPCYISSSIRSREYEQGLIDKGVEFGTQEDVAACMMRIAADRSINGHSFMIVPRRVAKEGFVDAGMDDHVQDGYVKSMQKVQLNIIKERWID